jgi:hypothetical protein
MTSRWVLAVVGAFSISLLTVGSGGAVVCNPICQPDNRGTNHAVTVANPNGVSNGLATAQQQPGNYKTPTGPCSGC